MGVLVIGDFGLKIFALVLVLLLGVSALLDWAFPGMLVAFYPVLRFLVFTLGFIGVWYLVRGLWRVFKLHKTDLELLEIKIWSGVLWVQLALMAAVMVGTFVCWASGDYRASKAVVPGAAFLASLAFTTHATSRALEDRRRRRERLIEELESTPDPGSLW